MLKIRRYKFIGVVLLALSLLTVGCGGKEEREDAYLLRAQEYFEAGNIEKAKIEVKNVRQINPNNVEAIFLGGLIAEEDDNFRGAFQSYSGVIQLDPKNVKALNKLAYFYIAGKQFEDGATKLETALELEPDNADSLALMGLMLAQQEGKEAEGQDYARRALAQDPANIRAITVLATTLAQQEDPQAALVVLDDGIALQPTDDSLKIIKIKLLLFMKRPDEVPPIYRQLIDQNPENIQYIFQLASFLAASDPQGREAGLAKAESLFRSEIDKNPDEDQLKIWLVKLLSESESSEAGIEALEQFVASAPDSEMLRNSLATGYIATEETGKAEALYLSVIENDPASVEAIAARNKLVSIAFSQNDQAKAGALIAEVLELDPENGEALIARARINYAAGDFTSVVSDMRVVLKNEPDSVNALALLANSNERLGSVDLALDGYQTLLTYQARERRRPERCCPDFDG